MSPTDEFKALLTLMDEAEGKNMSDAVFKLLNGWEKRTSDKDKRHVFSSIPKRDWSVNNSNFSRWIFAQKMLYPNDLICEVQDIGGAWDWIDSSDVAGSLQRMSDAVKICNDDEYIESLIYNIDDDFLSKVAKNPTNILLFENFLDALQQRHPKYKSACVLDLTDNLFKKIKFSSADKKQYETHRSLFKKIHYDLDCKTVLNNILPVFQKLNCEQWPYQLEKKMAALVCNFSFHEFSHIRTDLCAKGWSEAHLYGWSRPLNYKTFSHPDGWLTYWAQHSRMNLLDLLAPKITECLEIYLSSGFKLYLDRLTPILEEVHAAGITNKEINAYILKHPIHFQEKLSAAFEAYSSETETKLQKFCGTKNFHSTLKLAERILPPAVVGSILCILHTNGHVEAQPSQLLPLKAAPIKYWREQCYDGKQAQRAFGLQEQYLVLQQRNTIKKSLPKSSVTAPPVKRKI